jgi:hypothetical protein
MRVRQCLAAVFILLAGLFLWNMSQRPWWHMFLPRTGESLYIYQPILLFVLPLFAIGSYLLRFPDRLWQGRRAPFYAYSAGLLAISLLLFAILNARVTVLSPPHPTAMLPAPDLAHSEVLDPDVGRLVMVTLNVAVLICALPLWLIFLLAWIRTRSTTRTRR